MWVMDWDELYPVYFIDERDAPRPYEIEVDLEPEFVERYVEAWKKWHIVQKELEEKRREQQGDW